MTDIKMQTGESIVQRGLLQWPCKISLVPTRAPYFDGANLLIAADCTAFAYKGFHNELSRGRIILTGCPAVSKENYTEKLANIIRNNDIKSIRIVRMDAGCCTSLESAAREAVRQSGKFIPWQIITVSTEGKISED